MSIGRDVWGSLRGGIEVLLRGGAGVLRALGLQGGRPCISGRRGCSAWGPPAARWGCRGSGFASFRPGQHCTGATGGGRGQRAGAGSFREPWEGEGDPARGRGGQQPRPLHSPSQYPRVWVQGETHPFLARRLLVLLSLRCMLSGIVHLFLLA